MRWSSKLAVAAVAVAMPLAACSSNGPSDKGSSSGGSAPRTAVKNSAMDATVKGPAPEVSGAKKGGTLTITESGVPPTFDPAGAYYVFSMAALSGLTTRSLTGYQVSKDGSTLVPDLATDLGKESADGKTWTFKLKPGMKYSDGSAVKAADFVYGIERGFDEDLGGNGPVPYLQDYLVGGKDYKGPIKQPDAKFQGVTAQGDDTIVFHLTRKWPTLPYFMAFPLASPVPQAKDTKGTYQNKPLATGPYMVKSFTKGRGFELTKNTNWDPNSDPIRHQYPDAVTVKLGVTALTTQQQILANSGSGATTLDVSPDGVDASLIGQAKKKTDQYGEGDSPCESYIPLDTQQIPLEVRKAIAIAYPYDQIRKAKGVSPESYDPATTYAPPQVPGMKQYPAVNGLVGKGTGDPAKAKSMLKAAGKENFELSWYFINDDPTEVAANNAEKKAFTDAGFKVKDVGISKEQYSDKANDPSVKFNVGQGISSWCYDWPAGDSIYPQLFSSTTAKDARSVGNLRDTAVDKQLADIGAMEPAQAAPKWLEFDKQMTAQVVGIPTSYGKSNFVFGKQVHNVINDGNRGLPDFAQIWVG
ncbi:ABC transporter substrate-binding protein [Flexivirga meconopsidis]|uniref:ABC transporter substrate-binding protein n=1 Tax=Flexivirga meconopsidis TaxID=2977121 RepID=UPI00223EEB18|nr:ABC transporter substrate-binding protein [Flexivirga meconopsidis]